MTASTGTGLSGTSGSSGTSGGTSGGTSDGRALGGRRRTDLIRPIVGTAAPVYLSMLVSSVAALLDTALLGHRGTATLAAFAVALAVFTPVQTALAGVQRGVIPFVAAHREDRAALLPVVRASRWLGYAVGLLGAGVLAAVPLIGAATGTPPGTLARLGVFPALLAATVLVTALGATASSVLIGLGRAKAVMRAGLLGTATAVLLSVVLVRGLGPVPALGLTGAGLSLLGATAVSRGAAQLALRRSEVLRGLPAHPGRPDPRAVLRQARVGVPLAGTVLVKFAVLGVLTLAAARLGAADAAVQSVCVALANLLYTAAVAIGQAAVPLTAVAVRDRDLRRARRTISTALVVALGAVLLLGAVVLGAHRQLVPLFTADPAVRRRALTLLPLVLAAVAADALQAVAGFGLVALKRTVPSLLSTLLWFGLLGAAAVPIADAGGLRALWLALAAANLLQAVSKAASFRRQSARAVAAP
ncbi:MATE family efflux transporter [Kitasatospora sp. NBC_01287]|uniref:MATE family efflux transporter n=1 Tax=Kitasatospora sp. NBC_01287 TaxID=2903573 RepID=UPI002256D148|nr:MATE family efflux transporter [Kitasatospora sp. NBC_01287]MCX4748270.1 MATE family efflux transporter [Kitasatospora sp. NBC_01287]